MRVSGAARSTGAIMISNFTEGGVSSPVEAASNMTLAAATGTLAAVLSGALESVSAPSAPSAPPAPGAPLMPSTPPVPAAPSAPAAPLVVPTAPPMPLMSTNATHAGGMDLGPPWEVPDKLKVASTYGVIICTSWFLGYTAYLVYSYMQRAPHGRLPRSSGAGRGFAPESLVARAKAVLYEMLIDDDMQTARSNVLGFAMLALKNMFCKYRVPGFHPPGADAGTHMFAGMSSIFFTNSLCIHSDLNIAAGSSIVIMGIFIPSILSFMLASTAVTASPPALPTPDSGIDADWYGKGKFRWPGCGVFMLVVFTCNFIAIHRAYKVWASDISTFKAKVGHARGRLLGMMCTWLFRAYIQWISPFCIHGLTRYGYGLWMLLIDIVTMFIATDQVWSWDSNTVESSLL